ncbi:hypothetical protein C8R44DRAFT_872920 [Mycena epipterygia]|nr:hypothetical protein C8R44DRAFT_872920 [Mycena epipterygia]
MSLPASDDLEYTGRHRRYDSFYYQNDWLNGPQFQESSGPNRFPELWPHLVRESEYEEHHLRKAFRRKYRPYSDGRLSLSDEFLCNRRQLEGHLAACDATAIIRERIMTEAKVLEDAIRELLDLNFCDAWLGVTTWSMETILEPSYEHPLLTSASTWGWGAGAWDNNGWATPDWADQDLAPGAWGSGLLRDGAVWRCTSGELWRCGAWCTGVDSGDLPTPPLYARYDPSTMCLPHWKQLWPSHVHRNPRQSDRLRSHRKHIGRIVHQYARARHVRHAKIRCEYAQLHRDVAMRCTMLA